MLFSPLAATSLSLLDPGISQQPPTSAEKMGLRSILTQKEKKRIFGYMRWMIKVIQVAEINSLDEHMAVEYEIHRRGYNKYGVRSDAFVCILHNLC